MDRDNFKKSIILLGPKAVGKSSITEQIKQKDKSRLIVSADLLINLIAHRLTGGITANVDKNYAQNLQTYKKLFKFDDLESYVYDMAKIMQNPNLSPNAKYVGLQFWKSRMIESALYGINQPIFLDASADFGACFNLSDQDKTQIKSMFFMSSDIVLSRHSDFLKQFGTVAYLKPGPTYKNSTQERAHDESNQLYISNPESYEKFANLTCSAKDLFIKSENGGMKLNTTKLEEISNTILGNPPEFQ